MSTGLDTESLMKENVLPDRHQNLYSILNLSSQVYMIIAFLMVKCQSALGLEVVSRIKKGMQVRFL